MNDTTNKVSKAGIWASTSLFLVAYFFLITTVYFAGWAIEIVVFFGMVVVFTTVAFHVIHLSALKKEIATCKICRCGYFLERLTQEERSTGICVACMKEFEP